MVKFSIVSTWIMIPPSEPQPSIFLYPPRQTFQVTCIWRVFAAFFERFRIPPVFIFYVFFHAFFITCGSFSLKRFFSPQNSLFSQTTQFRKTLSSDFSPCGKIAIVLARSNFLNHQVQKQDFSTLIMHHHQKISWGWCWRPKDDRKRNFEGDYFVCLWHKLILLPRTVVLKCYFLGIWGLKFENSSLWINHGGTSRRL